MNHESNCLIGFLRGQFLKELPNFLTKTYTQKLSVLMIWRLHNGISEQPTTILIFSLMTNNMFLSENERKKDIYQRKSLTQI